MPAKWTMKQASPTYLRAAVILSGILSIAGLSAAIFAYLKFPHSNPIEHSGRWSVSVQSFEAYLFSYPALQVATFLVITIQLLRWRTVAQRLAEQQMAAIEKDPRLERLDPILLYKFVCAFVVLFETGLLAKSRYRAWVAVTDSF